MEKEYAKKVIDEIRKNPGIHYDKLSKKFPDEENGKLYRLLYGLKEQKIIIGEDTMIPPAGKRGLERNEFWVNEKNYLNKTKLNNAFRYWKL